MTSVYKFLLETIRDINGLESFAKPGAAFATLVLIIIVAWLAHFITRQVLIKIMSRIAKRTKTTWDDILIKRKVFSGLAHLVPAIILYSTSGFSYPNITQELSELSDSALNTLSQDYYFSLAGFLVKLAQMYFIFIVIFVSNSVLNAGLDIYNTTPYSKNRPIKGYIQLVKIFIFFLSGIMILAILLERDPTGLIAGLGAMAAVLLLVFKDTILGFVASIQLSANNMVKIGDWVEMRSRGADGPVIDITLNTIKVRNWDQTISTIPTYAMVSESFINWKGMEESGGRRIMRSVTIDMTTIKFCTSEMLNRFQKFYLIRDYVTEKENEIEEYNKKHNISNDDVISGRRQTNVGVFRKYLEKYLEQNQKVNHDMIFMVRQLHPSGKGLPIEIYAFSKEQSWPIYEGVQADIFDHVLAVIPEFELRVFQEPTGNDITRAISKN
jgi:miniconductance mechanosensitive channel